MGPFMIIFTILGGITAYRFWGDYTILAIITIIISIYQLGSLDAKVGIQHGYKGRELSVINYFTSLGIVVLFIISFFI